MSGDLSLSEPNIRPRDDSRIGPSSDVRRALSRFPAISNRRPCMVGPGCLFLSHPALPLPHTSHTPPRRALRLAPCPSRWPGGSLRDLSEIPIHFALLQLALNAITQ